MLKVSAGADAGRTLPEAAYAEFKTAGGFIYTTSVHV